MDPPAPDPSSKPPSTSPKTSPQPGQGHEMSSFVISPSADADVTTTTLLDVTPTTTAAATAALNTSSDSDASNLTVVATATAAATATTATTAAATTAPATTATTSSSGGGGAIGFFKRYSGWGLHSSSSNAANVASANGDPENQNAVNISSPATMTATTMPVLPEVKIESETSGLNDDDPPTLTAGSSSNSEGGSSSVTAASAAVDGLNPADADAAGAGALPALNVAGSSSVRSRLEMQRKRRSRAQHAVGRPCQTHSFHTDAAEVQHMERGLIKLMDDFNSGRLRAFGQGCSMEQMESIRDQQESLAKLHFELGARQEVFTPLSEDGLRTSNENMDLLMSRLEKLSLAIGKLDPGGGGDGNAAAAAVGGGDAGLKVEIGGANPETDVASRAATADQQQRHQNGFEEPER